MRNARHPEQSAARGDELTVSAALAPTEPPFPRVAHLLCRPMTGKCARVDIFIAVARFPQSPGGVSSVTPGCTITHLCVLDDLIW